MARKLLSPPFLLALILALQAGFWWQTHTRLPDMTIVPEVPGQEALQVMAFGDEEFLFRAMAFRLGNAGDTFGRFTALYKYDMHKVYLWFTLLDRFNHRSNLLPSMAAYYFSQTQKTSDVRYLVNYLYEHSKNDIPNKWWWMTQAVYLAMHRLKDEDLALKIAQPLTQAADIPIWARQMPAFIYERRGEMGAALEIIEDILAHADQIPDAERRFMFYFVEERLDKMKELDEQYKKQLLPLQEKIPAPNAAAPATSSPQP